METCKIANFERENAGQSFPYWRHVGDDEARVLRVRLGACAGVEHSDDLLAFTKELCSRGVKCSADANSDDFGLAELLVRLGLEVASEVFLNWYRFDDVDAMALEDVNAFFGDIWYPGADDLDLFDASCRWLLSVNHEGTVLVCRFRHTPSGAVRPMVKS